MAHLKDKWKQSVHNGNFFIGLAIFLMFVLFLSSAQTYEQQTTIPLLQRVLKDEPLKITLDHISFRYAGSQVSIQQAGYFNFIEFFIRKGAHFGFYFILGGSWFFGLQPRLQNIYLSGFVSWLAATGYAGLDEFHQMLTEDRTPLFQDVMLDSSGAVTACILAIIVIICIRLFKKDKSKDLDN